MIGTRQDSVQDSPFYLLFGREAVTPADVARDYLLARLQTAHHLAAQHATAARHRQEQAYNADHVELSAVPRRVVLLSWIRIKWAGPFSVTAKLGPETVFNQKHLKLCKAPMSISSTQLPSPPNRVTATKLTGSGIRQYLIEFADGSTKWLASDDLPSDYGHLVAAFQHQSRKARHSFRSTASANDSHSN